jgi:hypothetical protein
MKLDYDYAPEPAVEVQVLTDRLTRAILDYKVTREPRYLPSIASLATLVRALGYHPYFDPKNDALVVLREAILDQPTIAEHFDA